MKLCSKCNSRPALSYHSYCRECKQAYRRDNPEDRSKKYKRVAPFPELCGKCKQRPHAKGNGWCRECQNKAQREWYRRNPDWNKSTPERWQKKLARHLCNNRVKRGQMLKLPCFICGNTNVMAHHYLGYDKEHALDIIWLCILHHCEAEKKLWCPVIPKDYSLKTPLTPKTDEERFESRINRNGPIPKDRPDLGNCWLYTERLDPNGYGTFDHSGRGENAHRFAYRMAYGAIPEGCIIGHLCNVRNCCRPIHLVAWPKGDDVRYMEQCGRGVHLSGEANGRSKLTEADVREIRKLYQTKQMGCYRLAAKYGVSPQAIYDIVNYESWPDLK